jgi:hypothetical protein
MKDPNANDDTTGWAWAFLLGLVAVLEFLLPRTLSQWTQKKSKKWIWFRWVGVGAFAVLVWHLFFGIPTKKNEPEPPPAPVECIEPMY